MMPPATTDKPGVLAIVRLAWCDLGRAMVVMPWILLVALATLVILVLARSAFGSPEVRTAATLAADFVVNAALTTILTPACIAVHRAIILGEITPAYRLTLLDARVLRFLGWSLMFVVAYSAPEAAALAAGRAGDALIILPLFTAAIMLSVRLVVLLPAVSVDAPGASPSHALADTRDETWRILGVILLLMMPLYAALAMLSLLVGPGSASSAAIAGMVVLLVEGLQQATAARFYRWIGDRVTRPAA